MKVILFIATLFLLAAAHPTHYPEVDRNETCYKPTPAPIYSWHIHLLFWQNNDQHTDGAMKIRD